MISSCDGHVMCGGSCDVCSGSCDVYVCGGSCDIMVDHVITGVWVQGTEWTDSGT